jgi:hypothetical protein
MHFAGAYTHSYGALMTTRVFQAYVVPRLKVDNGRTRESK